MADLCLWPQQTPNPRGLMVPRPRAAGSPRGAQDNYLPNGKEGTIKGFKYLLSFQPRWDFFGRMMEQLATHVPVMTSTGNHEVRRRRVSSF